MLTPSSPLPVDEETRDWRRALHAIPELAFEERKTSAFLRERLESFGLDVRGGYAGTGLAAELKAGSSERRILLRADMDALPVEEATGKSYASTHQGRAHACGHDGHMAMLLGAAKRLCDTPDFDGRVLFVFQPAEESGAGAKVMIDDGLLDDFPCEAAFGLHSVPGIAAGHFMLKSGPVMAASDTFDITVSGAGGHGGLPHEACDPVIVAAHIIQAAQSWIARFTAPHDPAVISFTRVEAGQSYNVIPETAHLAGTARCIEPETRRAIEEALGRIANHIAAGFGASATLDWRPNYPATINSEAETDLARRAAAAVAGDQSVCQMPAMMGSEDFSYFLDAMPGCYAWIGAGEGEMGGCALHNPHFDFNDELLPLGTAYWCELARTALLYSA